MTKTSTPPSCDSRRAGISFLGGIQKPRIKERIMDHVNQLIEAAANDATIQELQNEWRERLAERDNQTMIRLANLAFFTALQISEGGK
jgi:hypothetical protein